MLKKLVTVLMTLVALTASAQITSLEQGKLYRFASRSGSDIYMTAAGSGQVSATSVSTPGKAETWYVSDIKTDASGNKRYRLRNYAFGKYLRSASYNQPWKLVGSPIATYDYLYLVTVGGTYQTLSNTNSSTSNDKMHIQGNTNAIVTWNADAERSMWTVSEVTGITPEQIEENWKLIEELDKGLSSTSQIAAALDAMFTTKGCTDLKSEYQGLNEESLRADANFQVLPATLQQMVIKTWRTANGTPVNTAWAEPNYDPAKPGWDGEYAKRYRIQKYEAYTNRDNVNPAFRTNIHSNFNNPTGIFSKTQQALYVMVEGTIKPGATLYLGTATGHDMDGDVTSGFQLKEGLNVIPFYKDLEWSQIYYSVNTLQAWDGTTNKTQYKITDFPDLKIHIEGGCVNGYYNAVGDDLYAHGRSGKNVYPQGDDENDWDYLAARNNLPDLTILAKYITFQFYFAKTKDDGGNLCNGTDYYFTKQANGTRNARIPDVLEVWDRICLSERLLMGVASEAELNEANAKFPTLDDKSRGIYSWTGRDNDLGCDYSEHYRQHYIAWGMTSGYMSGGWVASNYNVNTFGSILQEILDCGGTIWGPGHEIGHQNQKTINMNGLTEVTNNLFANVATWYGGALTSRVNGGHLRSVLEAFNNDNHDFFHNNIWGQTHMYYKLWLYYHLTGHNNKFYPRLYEYLRRDPMWIKYDQQDPAGGVNGQTPLLHFYRAACIAAGEDLTEFFEAYGFLTPMDHRFVGDYANSEYTQTKAQIDAVKAEIAALNLPKNDILLFINDQTKTTTYRHDGVTPRGLFDGYANADMGGYKEAFIEKSTATGNFTASLSKNEISVSGGTGCIGIKVYSTDGELLAFADRFTFPVSNKTIRALSNGKAVIKVYSSDGSSIEAKYDAVGAARTELSNLVNAVSEDIARVDNGGTTGYTYTKIGYYKKDRVAEITKILASAQDVITNNRSTLFADSYKLLSQAYEALKADDDAIVKYTPGATLVFMSEAYPTRYMYAIAASNKVGSAVLSSGKSVSSVPVNGKWTFETKDDMLFIKNVGTGKYVGAVQRSTATPLVEEINRVSFTKGEQSRGSFNFAYNGDTGLMLHCAATQSYEVVGWGDTPASRWTLCLADVSELTTSRDALAALAKEGDALVAKVESPSGFKYTVAIADANINIEEVKGAIAEARTLLAVTEDNTADLKASYKSLSTVVENLRNAIASVDNAGLIAARVELEKAIGEMDAFMKSIGTETKTAVPLQSTDSKGAGFLYCNAPHSQAGSDYAVAGTDGYHLLDGNVNTFLHTAYAGTAPNEDHYLRVFVGEQGINNFDFNYVNRNGGSGHIATLVVEGSDTEEGPYNPIQTLGGLPSANGAKYNSDPFTTGANNYKYIRFRVTANAIGSQYNGHAWFHLAEFRMNRTDFQIAEGSSLTMDDWKDCYNLNSQAAFMKQYSNSAADLEAMTEELRNMIYLLSDTKVSAEERTELEAMIAELQREVEADYTGALNPISDEHFSAANNALSNAKNVVASNDLKLYDYKKALANLLKAKTAFEAEMAYALLPIKLASSAEDAELYAIESDVAGNALWEYAATEQYRVKTSINISNSAPKTQLWYFVKGDQAPAVKIFSASAPMRLLSVAADGSIQVLAATDKTKMSDSWNFTRGSESDPWFTVNVHGDKNTVLTNGEAGTYVALNNQQAARIRFAVRTVGNTAVDAINGETGTVVIYNLQGIPVENPGEGVYIVNGKKVYLRTR